jgi:hypothetical protein
VRTFAAVCLIVVGAAAILIRHLYAMFLFSFVHTWGPARAHEDAILKSFAVLALIGGLGFIVLGCLMLMNLVFVWNE